MSVDIKSIFAHITYLLLPSSVYITWITNDKLEIGSRTHEIIQQVKINSICKCHLIQFQGILLKNISNWVLQHKKQSEADSKYIFVYKIMS